MLGLFYESLPALAAWATKGMPSMRTILAVGILASTGWAQTGDVEWKTARIASNVKEAYQSLTVDTLARVFIGGRDALFVYEARDGHYQARRLLYRFPANSSINDLAIRGNDLFALTSTALYILPDGARKRDEVKPRKLLWGVPGANVLRSMAWGPEGDLYIAFGNPAGPSRLSYWTFFSDHAKSKTPYRGPGGILRCKPDGTGLQLVAFGLQNPGGLAFDSHWNLFVCDLVKEDFAQLRHVTPHASLDRLAPMLDGIRPALACLDDGLLSATADHLKRLTRESRGADFVAKSLTLAPCKNAKALAVGVGRIFALQANGDLVTFAGKDSSFTA